MQVNIAIFGAEQVREQKATRHYFDKYYAAVNTGGLAAFGLLAYVQQNYSYFIGYTVPAGLLIIAFLFFLSGYKFYIHVEPKDSLISNFLPVLRNAFQMWRKRGQTPQESSDNRRNSDPMRLFGGPNQNGDFLSLTASGKIKSFFDYAKVSNQGKFLDRIVEDIKSLRRIIVVFLLLIPYWIVYIQVTHQQL